MKNTISNKYILLFLTIFVTYRTSTIIREYLTTEFYFPLEGKSIAYSLGVTFAHVFIITVSILLIYRPYKTFIGSRQKLTR